MVNLKFNKNLAGIVTALIFLFLAEVPVKAQFATNWLNVGDLQNWYSAIGSEIEEGLQPYQQFGLRWPAIYRYRDNQAYKAFWLGAKNVQDPDGNSYSTRVVHVGPRVNGADEFFPVKFELRTKFPQPLVTVEGGPTYAEALAQIDGDPDPDMPYDRMIYNEVNNLLGVTMVRKLYQFSQQYHDDYIVHEVTFINTGNTDDDPEIELPNHTVEDLYAWWMFRWAVTRETRYLIGNGTGWGMNTMLDARGEGVKTEPGVDIRAQFAWHGNFPAFTEYDNVGGPIWRSGGQGYISENDTIGRLGAQAFVGAATLHADTSPQDQTDNPLQPATVGYYDSDAPLASNNDAYNEVKMGQEYDWMSLGKMTPTHADVVETDGDYATATGDPSLGTSGGFSAGNGYGPYTLAPGDSVTIIWVEGASGLSRENAIKYGKQFKDGDISPVEKNNLVLTGKDSLFQVFNRAKANMESGWNIPQPPLPPSEFDVTGGGDKISITWDVFTDYDGPAIDGFEIYRAQGRYDSTYYLIHEAGPEERLFEDTELIRGVDYYYYIVSVGDPADNNGAGLTPSGALKSSRYYTQTYDPVTLKRPPGESMDDIRVVPNPYIISSSPDIFRFGSDTPDRMAFFNIPGRCTIRIYTEIGELVNTLVHEDGSGDEYWNCVTSSNQLVVSGIYIAVITNDDTGEQKILKFAVIR